MQMTVLQIAALKKVGKGTTVLLMDKNGGGAKAIAKELSGRGFRKVFVVNGGFQGWTGSKLQTRLSTSVSAIEVLSPGNLFGTQRMANTQRNTQVRADAQHYLSNPFFPPPPRLPFHYSQITPNAMIHPLNPTSSSPAHGGAGFGKPTTWHRRLHQA